MLVGTPSPHPTDSFEVSEETVSSERGTLSCSQEKVENMKVDRCWLFEFVWSTLLGTNKPHLGKWKNYLQKCPGKGYVSFLEGIFWDVGPLIRFVLFLPINFLCCFLSLVDFEVFARSFELCKIKSRTCVFFDRHNWTGKVRRIAQNRINEI